MAEASARETPLVRWEGLVRLPMSTVLDYQSPRNRESRYTWPYFRPFVKLAAVAIPLEIVAARLAYHTIGEVVSDMLVGLVVLLNIAAFGLAFAGHRAGLVALVVVFLLIVPYQEHLGIRWWRVHREAERIRAWADAGVAATGRAPRTLARYTFADRDVAPHIGYGGRPPGHRRYYDLNYWVGTPTTAHWWDPGSGWLYYAD